MTCHHGPNDPNCSSHPSNVAARQSEYREQERVRLEVAARTPDKEKYEILDFLRVGDHVVLKVLYPNCSKCSYEGAKVMVFLNVTEAQMLKWKEIDPHFRDPKHQPAKHEAPGPAARFPASSEGWQDAVSYAKTKTPRR